MIACSCRFTWGRLWWIVFADERSCLWIGGLCVQVGQDADILRDCSGRMMWMYERCKDLARLLWMDVWEEERDGERNKQ